MARQSVDKEESELDRPAARRCIEVVGGVHPPIPDPPPPEPSDQSGLVLREPGDLKHVPTLLGYSGFSRERGRSEHVVAPLALSRVPPGDEPAARVRDGDLLDGTAH